jgi:ribosomal protein S18 acetylase RimI-like enzyme
MGEVTVRWARLEDALALATVQIRSRREAYRGLLAQAHLDGLDPNERLLRWQEGLAAGEWPQRGTMVAERDGAIIGFATMSTGSPPEAPEIHAIYVTPEAWGTGAGRLLMAEAVRRLAAAGCTEAILWVLESNERARRFYEKAGWHADGGRAPHDVGGEAHTVVRYRWPTDPGHRLEK